MEIEAEIEVLELLHRQAKCFRQGTRVTPYQAKAAASWELKLGAELERLRGLVATMPLEAKADKAA